MTGEHTWGRALRPPAIVPPHALPSILLLLLLLLLPAAGAACHHLHVGAPTAAGSGKRKHASARCDAPWAPILEHVFVSLVCHDCDVAVFHWLGRFQEFGIRGRAALPRMLEAALQGGQSKGGLSVVQRGECNDCLGKVAGSVQHMAHECMHA